MSLKPAVPASYQARELAIWSQIRRYAVPRPMIERATQAREAGDWQAACAASNMDIRFALRDVAAGYSTDVADRLEEDLRHLAPDLVRWHLPRAGGQNTTLSPRDTCVLATYGDEAAGGPFLSVRTPLGVHFPQRLRLVFGGLPPVHPVLRRVWWIGSRYLWDVRQSDELRIRCGGGDRAPFFEADGTPRAPHTAASTERDNAAHTEHVAALHDAGDLLGAFAAAGVDIVLPTPSAATEERRVYHRDLPPSEALTRLPIAPGRWAGELAALHAISETWRFPLGFTSALELTSGKPGRVLGRVVPRDADRWHKEREDWDLGHVFPEVSWRRLPDLDLLRMGRITPEELHPLVRTALFPKRSTVDGLAGPPVPEPPKPARVRCRGEWHQVITGGGTLQLLSHPAEEVRREEAIVSLGGKERDGCYAVKRSWHTEALGGRHWLTRLPRDLHRQRREFFARVRHGDTDGVEAMLDAGFDPSIRDGNRRTVLHHLARLDHERLLPRLLAAGLDISDTTAPHETPLQSAVRLRGSPALIRALIAADGDGTIHSWDWAAAAAIQSYRHVAWDVVDELLARVDGEDDKLPESDYWWEDE